MLYSSVEELCRTEYYSLVDPYRPTLSSIRKREGDGSRKTNLGLCTEYFKYTPAVFSDVRR